MFVIVDKSNDSIHQEPTRPSWKTGYYKSEGAAKAGITRTIKFYDKAVADVERVREVVETAVADVADVAVVAVVAVDAAVAARAFGRPML